MLRREMKRFALGAGLLAGLGVAPAVAAPRQLPAETSIPVTLETTVSSATSRPAARIFSSSFLDFPIIIKP